MTLATGTRLGPYEIIAPAGAGGMGEVYRARDTRLDRIVAIKVLPAHLSRDNDLKQRFEREARAISSLNHPHICQLYDVGSQDGTDFLVMEFVEGQTLAQRLQKGALPIGEVLKIGTEVTEALETAHRHDIVHRDLKPGNVMLTKAGAKLMDFGLAKPVGPAPLSAHAIGPTTPSTPTMSIASLSAPAAAAPTQAGMVVGTFQYMAPEVLQGAAADARSDIFSFGCMLYEMITAQPAFKGKSQISVLAAILEHEPEPIATFQPSSPHALQVVLHNCLAKDPDQRIQTAHDLGLQLKLVTAAAGTDANAGRSPVQKRWLPVAVASVLLLLAAGMWLLKPKTMQPEQRLLEVAIAPPVGISMSSISAPAISPDASAVVFVGRAQNGAEALYLRRLDSPVARKLDGTELATYPFWSPNSTSVAFFAAGQMKRVDVSSGVVQVIAPAADGRGGAWNKDDVIIYSEHAGSPLLRVSAYGGQPQRLTELNGHQSHRWPSFLPDGRHFVFTAQAGSAPGGVFLATLEDPRGHQLTRDVVNARVADQYILFARSASVLAANLDIKGAKLDPENTLVVDRVRVIPDRDLAAFSTADNGTLAYASGETETTQLGWFDRTGREVKRIGVGNTRGELDLSRDGRRLVVDCDNPGGRQCVQIVDLERGASTPVPYGARESESAVWSPTGESVLLSTDGEDGAAIVRKWVDGSERAETLAKGPLGVFADDWSRDGRWVLYERNDKTTNFDLMLLDMHDRTSKVYLSTPANEAHARISPDGHWLAYTSDESGRTEVYIQSFPATGGGKWQVSTQGGDQAYWRGDSKELYYVAPDLSLMAVPIHTGTSLDIGIPIKLFNTHSTASGPTGTRNIYVASPDGKRFLVQYVPDQPGGGFIGLVLNWQQKVKSRPSESPR